MTTRLHLICRSALGVTCLDPKAAIYRSETWVLTTQEVEAMPGSRVYLHDTKSEPAYFGGTVVRADQVGAPDDRRYALILTADRDAKGVAWGERGHSHGMAWSSGLVAV